MVHHVGNDQVSIEEAEVISNVIREALTWQWHDPQHDTSPRPLTQADILVVTPFNAQRASIQQALAAAGWDDIRVGTVDKFQGQEAPVAILSMTASSPADVPRGMDFLISPNRINVAVSRAQWRATIVRNDKLTDYLPTSVDAMSDLGGFLRLLGPDSK